MIGWCWWCSNPFANKTYYSWYDSKGYYRYHETCSCFMCGKSGYRQNGYHCQAYPTLTITSTTNRFGGTTYTESCYYCGYYLSYSY